MLNGGKKLKNSYYWPCRSFSRESNVSSKFGCDDLNNNSHNLKHRFDSIPRRYSNDL